MTFSSKIKNDLSRQDINNECCIKSELSALIRTTGYITIRGFNKIEIEFITENAAVARRIFKMLKLVYNVVNEVVVKKSNRLKKHNNYIIKIEDEHVIDLLKDTKLIIGNDVNFLDFNYKLPKDLIKKNCCKRAYIRASFMGCGSISDPEKSYHAEFVNSKEEHSKGLAEVMSKFGLSAKIIQRKDYHITYLKDGEQIVDLLNIMGAYNALLDFENVRALKETRNRINRVINCETANLDKIVDASVRQVNSIKILKKYKAIDNLPNNLKDLAYLRLKNGNASLKELGELLSPPLGKSGVNHRLKKIEQIAKELLENKERGTFNEITKGNTKK